MKRSTDRILTTHCGSLPRPKDLLDLMKAKVNGEPYDHETYAKRVRSAVAETVRKQVESGIDIPTDGEQGKPGFFTYVSERLTGFAPKPGASFTLFADEVAAFPEYYQQYFSQAMQGGAIAPMVPLVCTGPVSYRGQEAVRSDIDNLKAALEGLKPTAVFLPAVAPSGLGSNEYYRTEEDYLQAVAEAGHRHIRTFTWERAVLGFERALEDVLTEGRALLTSEQQREVDRFRRADGDEQLADRVVGDPVAALQVGGQGASQVERPVIARVVGSTAAQ